MVNTGFYVAPCISAVFAIGRSQQMAGVSDFKTSVLFNPNIHFAKQDNSLNRLLVNE